MSVILWHQTSVMTQNYCILIATILSEEPTPSRVWKYYSSLVENRVHRVACPCFRTCCLEDPRHHSDLSFLLFQQSRSQRLCTVSNSMRYFSVARRKTIADPNATRAYDHSLLVLEHLGISKRFFKIKRHSRVSFHDQPRPSKIRTCMWKHTTEITISITLRNDYLWRVWYLQPIWPLTYS